MSEEDLVHERVMDDFELIYPRAGTKIVVEDEPAGRSGHSMVSDESNLYVFGGYNPLGRINQGQPTVLDELWKFNFATEKWTKIETEGCMNTCASSSLIKHGSKLYIFGGTSYPFGQINGNEIYMCDLAQKRETIRKTSPSTSSSHDPSQSESTISTEESTTTSTKQAPYRWHRFSDANEGDEDENKPPKGYGQSIVFHEQYMYAFGGAVGFYSEAIGDLYRLDLELMMWEKMSPDGEIPMGRYKQEIIGDSQGFYVLGGGRLHTAMPVHILYHYSFPENAWTKITTTPDPTSGTPKPRSAFGFAQLDRDVYICGGSLYGVNNQPHQVLQDMWRLSLDTFAWMQLSVSLPEPIYFHRASLSPANHLYMYGGVVSGGRRVVKMHRYRLPFQVAALTEMCWDVVCRAWRDGMGSADHRELVETFGVPRRFVQRLT
ncbi:hypothetical protein ACOMHN_061098 [Nucella lapillus]